MNTQLLGSNAPWTFSVLDKQQVSCWFSPLWYKVTSKFGNIVHTKYCWFQWEEGNAQRAARHACSEDGTWPEGDALDHPGAVLKQRWYLRRWWVPVSCHQVSCVPSLLQVHGYRLAVCRRASYGGRQDPGTRDLRLGLAHPRIKSGALSKSLYCLKKKSKPRDACVGTDNPPRAYIPLAMTADVNAPSLTDVHTPPWKIIQYVGEIK